MSNEQYVMKDSTKGVGGKEKSPQILASRRDDPSPSDKPVSITAESGAESIADKSGMIKKLNSNYLAASLFVHS